MNASSSSPGRARRPLRIAVAMLLTLAVAVVALWSWFTHPDVLAPRVERMAREMTGREVRLGHLELHLGRQAAVELEHLEVPSAAWDDGPALLRVERLRARVDLFALLTGTLIVDALQADGVRARLLRTAEQGANWRLRPAEGRRTESGNGLPFDLGLRALDVQDLELVYDGPRRSPVVVTLTSLSRDPVDTGAPPLRLRGNVDGRPLVLDGVLGVAPVVRSDGEVDLRLRGRFEGLELDAEGMVDGSAAARAPSLVVSLSGPAASDLEHLFGLPPRQEGDIDLRAALRPGDEGALDVELDGHLGAARIDADAQIADLRGFEQLTFDVAASGAELPHLFALLDVHRSSSESFELRLRGRRAGSRLEIDEARFDHAGAVLDATASLPELPSLAGGTAAMTLRGSELRTVLALLGRTGAGVGPFAAQVTLGAGGDGGDRLRAQVETEQLELRVDGVIAPVGEPARLHVEGEAADLRAVGELWGFGDLPSGALALAGDLLVEADALRFDGPFALALDDARAQLRGQVARAPGAVGTELVLDLDLPDPAALALPRGVALTLGDEPAELSGRLRIEADGYHLDDVAGLLGGAQLGLSGRIGPALTPLSADLQFDLAGPRLEALTGAVDAVDPAPGPFELGGRFVASGEAIEFEDLRLLRETGEAVLDARLLRPLERRSGRLALDIRGPDLAAFGARFGPWTPEPHAFAVDVRMEGSGQEWRVDTFEFDYAGASLRAGGATHAAAEPSGALRAELSVPSLARLGRIGGRQFRDQPLEASATLRGDAADLRIDDLSLRLGESDLAGTAVLRTEPAPGIDLILAAERLLWTPLLETDPAAPASAEGDGRLIPELEVPAEALRGMNGSLALTAQAASFDRVRLRDLDLQATLTDGVLEIEHLRAAGLEGRIALRATLDARGDVAEVHTSAVARGFGVGLVSASEDGHLSRADLDVDLRASGRTLRELAADLDGALLLDVRGGRLEADRLSRILLGDLFSEIVSAVRPGAEQRDFALVDCIVVPLRFDAGLVDHAPNTLVRTGEVHVGIEGTLDLRDERIELFAHSRPRRTLSLSAAELVNPYVKFVGTLARPRPTLDQRGALISGGVAALSGGLSILGRMALDRFGSGSRSCDQTVEKALEELGERLPDPPG